VTSQPSKAALFSTHSILRAAVVASVGVGLLLGTLASSEPSAAEVSPGWTAPAAIPSAETHAQGPALTKFEGLLYAVWAGESSPYHLWYSTFNGTSWSAQTEIPDALTNYETGPSVAVYEGELYVAWQAQSLPTDIWYSAFNGSSWTPQTDLKNFDAFNSSISGLAVYNGDLYLSWLTTSFAIDYATFNGTSWSSAAAVPSAEGAGFESDDVSLAVYSGNLYVAWESPSSELMYEDTNGTTWSSPKGFDGQSDAGPALAAMGTKLYAVWDDFSALTVEYSTFDGTTWKAAKAVPGATYNTEVGPGVGPYNGSIYVAWLPTSDPSPIDYVSKT
jgi:hypothetical protein